MSSLGMAIFDQGIEIGENREREKMRLDLLENCTVNRHIPFKEAADLLLIPEEEHEKYRALLEQKLTPEN